MRMPVLALRLAEENGKLVFQKNMIYLRLFIELVGCYSLNIRNASTTLEQIYHEDVSKPPLSLLVCGI